MSTGGEAAEEIVRISLQGVEFVGKMSMDAAERLINQIAASLKNPEKTKGRASLAKMMKTKKPVEIFEIRDKDLKKFFQEAKKYGVLYHVLKDKSKDDGLCDIMVRQEDLTKVKRILHRFDLYSNNKATVRTSLDKVKAEIKKPKEKEKPEKSAEDKFIDALFEKPAQKEKSQTENPTMAKTEKSPPSERSYDTKGYRLTIRDKAEARPSVRAELNSIKAEQEKSKGSSKQVTTPNKSKSKGKKKNGRNR